MTWAYAANSDHRAFPRYGRNQLQMYEAIKDCVERASKQFNIPVVIPSGEAVQIARGTRLNNDTKVPATSKVYQLTRDGYHLTRQHGRYIAACTWFETLIKPVLGKSVLGNGYQLLDTEYSIPAKDARLCQKCAVKAVKAYQ
jgi:beta-glucosidase